LERGGEFKALYVTKKSAFRVDWRVPRKAGA
jgi:hypothetical protein